MSDPTRTAAAPESPLTAADVLNSWNGIPHIKKAVSFYKDMHFITDIIPDQNIIITYMGVWYSLGNNGGEVTISKINDAEYFAEFPTVYFDTSLNADTLMYRLRATLNGEAIDYKRREDDDLQIIYEDADLVSRMTGVRFS